METQRAQQLMKARKRQVSLGLHSGRADNWFLCLARHGMINTACIVIVSQTHNPACRLIACHYCFLIREMSARPALLC